MTALTSLEGQENLPRYFAAVFEMGRRIACGRLDIVLDDGRKLDPESTYSVSGWATVNRTPDGRLMWDVVRDYILAAKGEDNVLRLAKINHPELVNVMHNPGIADYPGKAS